MQLDLTESIVLAGLPTLQYLIFSFLQIEANLSIILSTAILDGAQANTFEFSNLTVCLINSQTVLVLPVPGGPWIRAIFYYDNAFSIALICESFNSGQVFPTNYHSFG